nr:DUF2254 domain-containing protein [Cohaesibacter intestini]
MTKWQWVLLQTARRLWVRAALIGALGVAAAILATLAETVVPWELGVDIRAEAVDSILSIIASSMLAVTTFSLSVMTSAYQSATSNATPRATKLLIQDNISQTVLSTFVGSFLFSIVGLIVLKTGAYGPQGRAVLFAVTIIVIALIVVSLLRWIDYLTQLGRVENAADQVEEATRTALQSRLATPYLGSNPLREDTVIPSDAVSVYPSRIGYIQHIDMPHLSACIGEREAAIYFLVDPGSFVFPDTPMARFHISQTGTDRDDMDRLCSAIQKAVIIKDERSFDQDPRFGLCVLSEIGMRALSPGINDPGTAIDVIGRLTRLLHVWAKRGCGDRDEGSIGGEGHAVYDNIFVPPLTSADLFDDAFNLLARDGDKQIEVQLRLRKSLKALSRLGDHAFRRAAQEQAALALKRAQAGLVIEDDKARLEAIVMTK